MEELVILDYSNSSVHFYKADINADLNYDYIAKLGFNPDSCSWMFAEDIDIIYIMILLNIVGELD